MTGLGNPLLMMGVLFVMRYVNFTDTKTVLSIKIAYAVMQTATFLMALLIRSRILSSKETGTVVVPEPRGTQSQTMTIKEYDLSQLKQLLNQTLIGTMITIFINYKWKVMQPLFIQSVLAPKNMMTNPLFRIYIMGEKAIGKLSRPFKTENPLMDLLKQVQQPTTQESTSAAPVTQAAGISEERLVEGETERSRQETRADVMDNHDDDDDKEKETGKEEDVSTSPETKKTK
jgi:hypothetical protein